jgi:putative component of membrane protein insertase Oxa1/YidC/SpoIIIJ protein YidD
MRFYWLVWIFVFIFARQSFAAWDDAQCPWAAPGKEYSDWTTPPPPRPRESWERLAVRDTPLPQTTAPAALLGEDLLWFYQHTLSGNTGTECPHYPSCSRYSLIAVDDYGLVIGVIMTAERLERCHDDANDVGQYPWRDIDGQRLIWDPPVLDAWWTKGHS